MANSKISALSSATTPLAGTETLPIVQAGSTVKATIANIQATPVTAGSANSIQYLNASKVPSTTSTFVYDGKNVGLGIASPTSNGGSSATVCHVNDATVGNWAINHYTTGSTGSTGGDGFICGLIGDAVYLFNYENSTINIATSAVNRIQISGSGDVTVNTGNLIQGTAAKGINFTANTPAAGMTSQLLNWYEEGTWTPNQGGLTVVGTFSSVGSYTRVGRLVTVHFSSTGSTSISVTAGNNVCTNLPFTSSAINVINSGTIINAAYTGGGICGVEPSTKNVWSASTIGATGTLSFTITYRV